MQHAGPAFAVPQTQRHFLNDKAKTRVNRGPFGLTQKAGRGAFPRAGHRPKNLGQLHGGGLGEGLFRLFFIGHKCVGQALLTLGVDFFEYVGIKPCDVDRVSLDEPLID